MRPALLGCGLERNKSPLRLAQGDSIILSPEPSKHMTGGSFWSFCTSGFSRRLLFQAKKRERRRRFLLLRLSYSFLILSSFLAAISARRILTFIPAFEGFAPAIHNHRYMSVLRKTVRRNPDIYPGYFLDSWISTNPDNFPGRS